jgi:AcrR family transcriptional regulator
MANFISKLIPSSKKRRVSRSARDGKTAALFDAGARLLARYDHDHVYMARLAKEAGCSVGALYNRFQDKETFLYHLASSAFRTLREDVKSLPDGQLWPRRGESSMAKQFVSHVVGRMTTRKAAGVIRAAMKLAPTHPLTMELFEDYRSDVTECAVKVFLPYVREGGPPRIRIAVQIVLATITNAILQTNPGPLQAGSSRMIAALSNVMCGYLGFETGNAWAGDESDGEDVPEDRSGESEEAPITPPGQVAQFDPDMRLYKGTTEVSRLPHAEKAKPASSNAGFGKSAGSAAAPIASVTPSRTPPPMLDPDPKRPLRTKRVI